ncbi:flagellar basal body P-ring biosynthesis protein FlgA [Posidoniimonas polymericola]|uniref:Flagellar basal body P-ring biosynthesis protein FlgA n=1 Tax=Posidoniimonas polymericola TaxID=2528002 RepID=A0A5C5YG87_9BACT|nr:flagellar basal body P-ring formation chaperone FlgA [Posidoniimonas polymericola]TWT73531.1 flagellar basal body P-ring biosynthesis protein FlgA [Posidoniimonas polymericola]
MLARFFNSIGLALLTLTASAGAADLHLLEHAQPKTGVVRVEDVAAILNAGPAEIEALGRIALMPSPAPGQQQVLRSQGVRELLAAHGVDLSGLRFRGASETLVSSRISAGVTTEEIEAEAAPQPTAPLASQPQTGFRGASSPAAPADRKVTAPRRLRLSSRRLEQLNESLTQQLTEFVQTETADGMLYVTGVELKEHNAMTLAANRGELRITASTALRVGRQRFVLSFTGEQGEVKFPVLANIVEARPAVIARRDVPRGMVVTAADVHIAPLPTDFRPRGVESVASSLDEVLGKEAITGLRAGDVLTDGNCLPPVMVQRNALVSVSSGRGAIRVRTQAKARTEGRLGDIIEVETLDSRERLQARVVGRGRLAVLTVGGAEMQAVAENLETLRLR